MKRNLFITRDSYRLESQNLRRATIIAINRLHNEKFKYEDNDYKCGYNSGFEDAIKILREEIREITGSY